MDGSCWLSVWWKCSRETGNFIKLGGRILTVLLFSCGWEVCPSQLWSTSFNLWNWIQISSGYTNHNPIWFESQPCHFRKKCDNANHQSGQKQAIHTTANRITRGLLAGRLSAFRCADVQGGLAAVNKFKRWSIYDLKVMQEKDVENLHDLVVYPTQNEESTFPMFNSFLDSFRKTTSNLVTKIHGTNSFQQITNNQDLPHMFLKDDWSSINAKSSNITTLLHPELCAPTQPPLILGWWL